MWGGTYSDCGSPSGCSACNLRKGLTGQAQAALERPYIAAQRHALGVNAVPEMAELVQNCTVLGKYQQQRQNPREPHPMHIRNARPHSDSRV